MTDAADAGFVERRLGERRGQGRRSEERDRIRLAEQLIAAEQDERRRLALFLHDGPVQNLSGIALMLDAVIHALDEGRADDAKQVLTTVLKRQRETIRSLRDLSFNLEPIVLRDAGFEAAVRALAELLGLSREIQITVDVTAGEALSQTAQVALYQIIRDVLEQATGRRPNRITITVRDLPNGDPELTIVDDGHVERRRGSADAIEERVRPLSGQLSVVRSDDGTTVRVVLPDYAARA